MKKFIIVELSSYEGDDTSLTVSPNPMYVIVNTEIGEVDDYGYRSREEALKVCTPRKE
jgi:hypothetical protein